AGIAAGKAAAAVASAPVATLTEGVVRMMVMGKLRSIAVGVLGVAVLSAAAVALAATRQERPKAEVTRDAPARPERRGTRLEGVVVDEAGKPVAGAEVSLFWAVD